MLLALAKLVIKEHFPQYDPSTVVPVDIDYSPPEPDTTQVFQSNFSKPITVDQYQELVQESLINTATQSAIKTLVEKFSYQYVSLPYIAHLTEDQFQENGIDGHEAVSCIRKPTEEHPNFWQTCIIATPYGNVYLSTALNDVGNVPDDTEGIFINYDSSSTKSVLFGIAAEHPERFTNEDFMYSDKIQNESELKFLLGDVDHPHTVAKYMQN